jgi:drug/metabolite transporter (DMT)-like permease
MAWALLSFLAATIWSGLELLDKFVVDHEVDDFFIDSGINGFALNLTMIITAALFGNITFSAHILFIGLLIGFVYSISIFFYYKGMKSEEVSRFVPTISINTIFIVILSFVFLGERFSPLTYFGIVLAVGGAFLVSLENPRKSLRQIHSEEGFLLGLLVAVLFGVREVAFKYFVSDISFWNLIFWMSIGGFISSVFLLILKREEAVNHTSVKHLAAIGVLAGIAFVLFAKAISIGPVTLSSAITRVQPLLVLAGSAIIARQHPEIISEEIDKNILIQKALAVSLTVVGLVIVTFT